MKISSLSVSQIRPEYQEKMARFTEDDSHQIAVTGEISKTPEFARFAFSNELAVQIGTSTLQPISTKMGFSDESLLVFKRDLAPLTQSILPFLAEQFPVAGLVLDGMDWVLAPKDRFDVWCDPEKTSVVKNLMLIKTGEVMVEVLKIAQKNLFPESKIASYLNAIGLILTVGGTVYQFCADISDEKILYGNPRYGIF